MPATGEHEPSRPSSPATPSAQVPKKAAARGEREKHNNKKNKKKKNKNKNKNKKSGFLLGSLLVVFSTPAGLQHVFGTPGASKEAAPPPPVPDARQEERRRHQGLAT